jgi:hypothetical protein
MALAAAAGATFLLAPTNAAGARDLPGERYGMVASNANFVPGDTVAERAKAYRRFRRAGVSAIRLDINWVQVEPPGEPLRDFDFEERDREVRAIRRAGLRVIGLLAYGHPDYSRLGAFVAGTAAGGGIPPFYVLNAQYFPPDDPGDFARYARATARHYGDEVIAWEIWNEQNEGWRFWPPREQPTAYARLLCAAHEAVRAVDPRTPVVYGGLFFPAVADLPGMSAPRFLQATYDADPHLGRCYEAMAYHPYPYPFTAPELDVPIRGSVLSAADQMRAVLERNGDGEKPLWITEVGWPTHDRSYGVSERKHAQYVARMQAATFAQRLPVLTWYTYGDYGDPTGLNQEAWFGFFRPDGSAKPAYAALRTFARVFRSTRFGRDRSRALRLPPGELMTGGRGFALEYRGTGGRRGERITAVWLANESVLEGQGGGPDGGSAAPDRARVDVPVRSRRLRIVDYVGNEGKVRARRGSVGVEAGPGPVYLIDRG